jgi:hypothetical protein
MFKQKIHWLLAAFVILGVLYSLASPLFEVSDELWHYPMVKTLADGNGLPVQDPANVQLWRQEGSQPPLYYALMALATFWIDTRDMETVRWVNPHVDNGIVTEDRNINLVIHAPNELSNWGGTALAVRLIRWLSVLMGAGTVYFSYRLALELMPERQGLALSAAAITAFTPMFLFISASVNNDNLAIVLSAATVWLLVRWLRTPPTKLSGQHLVLGLLLGAGALSKQSALGLWGLAGLVMLWNELQPLKTRKRLIPNPLPFLIVFGTAALVVFWWYWRNFQLYGDWLGWNTFVAIAGARPQPASLWQLWGERESFIRAYWGLFGGVNISWPDWCYWALNAFVALAVVGGLWKLRHGFASTRDFTGILQWGLLLVWLGLLMFGLTRWSGITQASQGRLIFPAISAISVLVAVGLGQLHFTAPWLMSGVMLLLAVVSPVFIIAPQYAPPPALTSAQIASIPNRLEADFGEVKLLGYELHTASAQPNEAVPLTLYWQSQIAMDRNWSIFVHLIDDAGVIVAQRDRYPGEGNLASSFMKPGQTWKEEVVLWLPPGLVTPATAQFRIGLYDARDGARLPLVSGSDAVGFGSIELRPRATVMPNAIQQNLGGVMELSGYEVSARALQPGETFTATLYWQALQPMNVNYSVSVRVRDSFNNHWASVDAWPQNGNAPTAAWQPGQTITDTYTLTLSAEAPPGQQTLEVVVYDSATLKILQLWDPDGYPTDANAVRLTGIRVVP